MLEQMGKAAKAASYQLAVLSTAQKDRALLTIADLLEAESAPSSTVISPAGGAPKIQCLRLSSGASSA